MRELIFLKPVFTHNIWGGSRLHDEFGYDIEGSDIGECWGIAAHPNGDSTVAGGSFDGMKLSRLYEDHRELFGGIEGDKFPLLIKIIDAHDNLSIQVHPDDGYAGEHENGSLGKTECWYIIDCPDDARLVVGHNAASRAELESMIYEGRWDSFIRELPIAKGDFIQIDPGTVHAITTGCLILETQQNSDITYRVYDYDRLTNGKPRELHVKQSIDVITVPAKPARDSLSHTANPRESASELLIENNFYKVFKISVKGGFEFEQSYPFLNVSVIEGGGRLDGHELKKGAHLIAPAGYGKMRFEGDMTVIASAVSR
ncbi:MAG: class I mannose-6-phosphate isomerase [Butyrivibrio sp.]|nr:class I mannose-6-phosphate isomerase [Butyrivibrio sp.]